MDTAVSPEISALVKERKGVNPSTGPAPFRLYRSSSMSDVVPEVCIHACVALLSFSDRFCFVPYLDA